MNIIKRIFLFFKNLLFKQEDIKMIEKPKEEYTELANNKDNFINSLKINEVKKKKKKVETLVCDGDGLGIQGGIRS